MALFLISYDISVDQRRNRLAKLLEGYGSRVQYSVFECDLTPAQWKSLRQQITKLVVIAEGDSVRMYQLCAATNAPGRSMGQENPPHGERADSSAILLYT